MFCVQVLEQRQRRNEPTVHGVDPVRSLDTRRDQSAHDRSRERRSRGLRPRAQLLRRTVRGRQVSF